MAEDGVHQLSAHARAPGAGAARRTSPDTRPVPDSARSRSRPCRHRPRPPSSRPDRSTRSTTSGRSTACPPRRTGAEPPARSPGGSAGRLRRRSPPRLARASRHVLDPHRPDLRLSHDLNRPFRCSPVVARSFPVAWPTPTVSRPDCARPPPPTPGCAPQWRCAPSRCRCAMPVSVSPPTMERRPRSTSIRSRSRNDRRPSESSILPAHPGPRRTAPPRTPGVPAGRASPAGAARGPIIRSAGGDLLQAGTCLRNLSGSVQVQRSSGEPQSHPQLEIFVAVQQSQRLFQHLLRGTVVTLAHADRRRCPQRLHVRGARSASVRAHEQVGVPACLAQPARLASVGISTCSAGRPVRQRERGGQLDGPLGVLAGLHDVAEDPQAARHPGTRAHQQFGHVKFLGQREQFGRATRTPPRARPRHCAARPAAAGPASAAPARVRREAERLGHAFGAVGLHTRRDRGERDCQCCRHRLGEERGLLDPEPLFLCQVRHHTWRGLPGARLQPRQIAGGDVIPASAACDSPRPESEGPQASTELRLIQCLIPEVWEAVPLGINSHLPTPQSRQNADGLRHHECDPPSASWWLDRSRGIAALSDVRQQHCQRRCRPLPSSLSATLSQLAIHSASRRLVPRPVASGRWVRHCWRPFATCTFRRVPSARSLEWPR